MKPKLTVLCGIQGSGKSTYARNQKVEVVSSDAIRKEFPGIKNDTTFQKVYERINQYLKEGKDVILDATDITNKSRRQVFQNVKEPCIKECLIFNTPYNTCIERVKERNNNVNSHKVPEEVVEKYYQSFQIPFYEEGWDKIDLVNKVDIKEADSNMTKLFTAANGFNQRNKHHTQDLGQHLESTGKYLKDKTVSDILISAGYAHDLGKLFTQTVGKDGQCHYYSHENVGTYNLMCISGYYNLDDTLNIDKTLEWLFYINYHMIIKDIMSEKSKNKWKNIFGDIKYRNLELLHEADSSTHV